ncbi:MAG: hypothetical protein WC700_18555 [Gemmatimonadaceae bacterium]|jgi:hypothetical protein
MPKPDPIDLMLNDWPVCPHCGHVDRDAWEYGMHDGNTTEVECGSCDGTYSVECCISVRYTTAEVPDGAL